MSLKLDIVTPEKKVFSETVEDVYLPTQFGETGILSGHTALVVPLTPGILKYKINDNYTSFAIGDGFIEASDTSVTVLTDVCLTPAEVDLEAVTKQLADNTKRLEQLNVMTDAKEIAELELQNSKLLAQKSIKG